MRWALLLVLLGGCAAPAMEPAPTPAVVTDPRDYSYLDAAEPGSHIHDYWGGRDEVTVLDVEHGGMSASCSGCGDGMQVFWARPEEGIIVPQGTAWLNITATWSASTESRFTGMQIMVKTAKDAEERTLGATQNGVTFTLNSSQEMNDPPHYVLSLWRFGLKATGGQEVSFEGKIQVKAVAVRGLPLVPYPPHPDRWQGETELVVAQDRHTVTVQYERDHPQGGSSKVCYGGCVGWISPLDGAVVPFETGGLPTGLGLRFHGADTWTMTSVPATMPVPGTLVFEIPVSGLMADSPYAPQSLWEFQLFLDEPGPLRAWTGTYTFEARAIKA
jgi:hypothetical protein